jgi:hypothetical protein
MSSGSASLLDVVAIVAVVVVIAIAVLAFLMRRAGSHPYQAAGTLLSPAERSLLDALRQAVGAEHEVFPKVQLAELLTIRKGLTRKQRAAAADDVARRRAGFVICDAATHAVRAIVETEEPRRHRPSRHGQPPFLDAALAAARIPLVRVPVQESYTAGELRDRVAAALRSEPGATAAPRGRLVRLMEAAVPATPTPADAEGVVGRLHSLRRRSFVPEGPESAASWLPTRGVLAVAAVLLIVGAVLSWFVEAPTPAPPSATKTAPAPAPKAVARPVPKAVEPAVTPVIVPQEAPQAEREIVGYRDVRVPGRPLEECMGPDREINPEVLRCRDGYTVREPIYR